MARFKDLPNEIVLEILKNVLPKDLETFAQTSKRVFGMSESILKQHRQFIRFYEIFDSHPPSGQVQQIDMRDGFTVGPVPALFKDVSNNPRIGHYIRQVKLDRLLTTTSKSLRFVKRYKQQCDLVDFAVSQSEVPQLHMCYDFDKRFDIYSAHCSEEVLVALLLPLLPNLNSLSMKLDARLQYLPEVLRHGAFWGVPWLANLTIVRLEECAEDGFSWLSNLGLFNSIPTLKSITAVRVREGVFHETLYQESHATELKLLKARVATQPLYWYLESFPRLQNLTIEFVLSLFDVNDRDRFDPCWIRSALVTNAQATLQTLVLLGPARRKTFMGTLRGFRALTELHTEWCFLFPEHCDLDIWPSRVLPASLRTLRLRDQFERSGSEYKDLIGGLQRAKRHTCSHLTLVDFETEEAEVGMVAVPDELYAMCQGVGVTLRFAMMD